MPSRLELVNKIETLRALLARAERDQDLYAIGLYSSTLYAEAERTIDDLHARLLQTIRNAIKEAP